MVPKNTVEQSRQLARLMELVALANAMQNEREYNLGFFRGKWISIWYYPIETLKAVYIVEKDTGVTAEEIDKAIKAMEKELKKCTRKQ